jgi:hypothetical protein
MADLPNQFGVTVGGAQFTFSDQPGAAPRARAVVAPPKTGASRARTRAARTQQPGDARPLGWLVDLIMGAIKRYREGHRIDELHRLEIEQRGKCSTPRCPWPRAVTDKCTQCESDDHNATRNPVVVSGRHHCTDGSERAIDSNGKCNGPCPTPLAGRRRAGSRKPRSVVARGG